MNQLLNNIRPYMLSSINLEKFQGFKAEKEPSPKKEEIIDKKKSSHLFIPKYKDTLFWCFYILTKGWENFYLVGRRSFAVEKEYKIACIEKLRDSKDLLKKNKWKRNILENNLLNDRIISNTTFICLCALHNMNIGLIGDYYYYIHQSNSLTPFFYIKKNNDRYGIDTQSTQKIIKELENIWKIDNMKKPLRVVPSIK